MLLFLIFFNFLASSEPPYPILPPTSSQNTCTDSSSDQSLVILDTLFQTGKPSCLKDD